MMSCELVIYKLKVGHDLCALEKTWPDTVLHWWMSHLSHHLNNDIIKVL